MAYSQEIRQGKILTEAYTLIAGSTPAIDLLGGTLTGVLLLADITSTTFTIEVSNTTDGTFVTVKDPLAAGAAITYTIGSSATGYFPISPFTTFGFRFCKIVFSASETPTIYITKRNLE